MSVSSRRLSGKGRDVVAFVRIRFDERCDGVRGVPSGRFVIDGEGVGDEDMRSGISSSSEALRFREDIVGCCGV